MGEPKGAVLWAGDVRPPKRNSATTTENKMGKNENKMQSIDCSGF